MVNLLKNLLETNLPLSSLWVLRCSPHTARNPQIKGVHRLTSSLSLMVCIWCALNVLSAQGAPTTGQTTTTSTTTTLGIAGSTTPSNTQNSLNTEDVTTVETTASSFWESPALREATEIGQNAISVENGTTTGSSSLVNDAPRQLPSSGSPSAEPVIKRDMGTNNPQDTQQNILRTDEIRRIRNRKSRPSKEEDYSVLGKVVIFVTLSLIMAAASLIVYGTPVKDQLKKLGGWCRHRPCCIRRGGADGVAGKAHAEKHVIIADPRGLSPSKGEAKAPQTAV